MRPLETLVIFTNLLAFFVLTIPLLRSLSWLRYVVPSALLVASVQIVVEGLRWQMLPAYLLTSAFFLAWMLLTITPSRPANRLVVGLAVGLGGVALAVSTVLPLLLPVFHFRKPTGPYAIGTLVYHWIDTSRPELFTTNPNDHRELMAQVWYPATTNAEGPKAPYIQHADTWAVDTARVLGFPRFMFSHFKYVTTNAVIAAPMATNLPRYPVLIYQTGLDGFRSASTFQIEELVSHGYVVVGLDQPGVAASVTFPDGKHIAGWPKADIDPLIDQAIWPKAKAPVLNGVALPDGITPYFGQDASFAFDQLASLNQNDPNHVLSNRLDLSRVGTFGISLGGMGVAETCAKDVRFKACLIMDVYIPQKVVRAGLKQPTMLMTRNADTMRLERKRSGGWSEKDITSTLDTMRLLYDSLPGEGYYLEIPQIFHVNFTDVPYWVLFSSYLGLTGPIGGQHGFDIINAYSLAFFDRHLKNQSATRFDDLAAQYPEVIVDTR